MKRSVRSVRSVRSERSKRSGRSEVSWKEKQLSFWLNHPLHKLVGIAAHYERTYVQTS